MVLAALATAAVRGLRLVAVGPGPEYVGGDEDVALVQDQDGTRWIVRAPRSVPAATRLDTDLRVAEALPRPLPFAVSRARGRVLIPDVGPAAVVPEVLGRPVVVEELSGGPGLAAAIGRCIAAIHEVPAAALEETGIPSYDAEEHRLRRLGEVDAMAGTGRVPAELLSRWEKALEETTAWRFIPVPVHGELGEECVLVEGDQVMTVLDWSAARVGDPADDLGWLAVAASTEAWDAVLEAYAMARREQPDADLARRAGLAGELAVGRYLLHGVRTDDPEVVQDAVSMLEELQATIDVRPW